MVRRMAIALLSLLAGMVSTYLHLYKVGLVGNLTCASGDGCNTAMFSPWGSFVGVDVALIGAIGNGLILGLALASLQPRWQNARWPLMGLLLLSLGGLAFTLRLKYGEFLVLHTFCAWCAVSTVAITLITILAVIEYRRSA